MLPEAKFSVVGGSNTPPYSVGDDIVIPYLDGILFSGIVNTVYKKQILSAATNQKTMWGVECLGDYLYLQRELVSSPRKYTTNTAAEILIDILGEEWVGSIDATYDTMFNGISASNIMSNLSSNCANAISDGSGDATIFEYTSTKSDKKSVVEDIISQVGYVWSVERPLYRLESTTITDVGEGEYLIGFTGVALNEDELLTIPTSKLIFTGGGGKYLSGGIVVSNTDSTITISNTSNIDLVSAGDKFIVTRHPIFNASPCFEYTSPVKTFTANKNIFNFDVVEDKSNTYNCVCVRTHTPYGDPYVSYLPAIYEILDDGSWKDCTYISNDSVYSTPDTYVVGIDTSTNSICLNGTNLNISLSEVVDIGGYAYSVSGSIVENDNDTTTISLSTFDISSIYVGAGFLRRKIYVSDVTNLVSSGGLTSVYIGNELITDATIDTYYNTITASSRQSASSSPHIPGTIVRSANAIGKDGISYVSTENPQTDSPVDKFGFVKIKTTTASTNTSTAGADRYATTILSTGSISDNKAVGTITINNFTKVNLSGLIGNVPIQIGDIISVNYYIGDELNTLTAMIYEYTCNFDSGVVDIKLGDYEINTNMTLSQLTKTIDRFIGGS